MQELNLYHARCTITAGRPEHSVAERHRAPAPDRRGMFENHSILIVEDELLVGIELAQAVQRHGGRAIGPLPTVAEALALLDTTPIAAAILDVQLLDRDITPVALRLIATRTPIVIQTGTGLPEALSAVGIDLPVVMKPAAPERVLDLLSAEIKKRLPQ